MIATNRQGNCFRFHDLSEECADALEGALEINWINGRIAKIRDAAKFVGRNLRDRVNALDQARHISDLPRTMARSRPIRRAAIPRHARDGDVQLTWVRYNGKPHECGMTSKARRYA